MSSVTKLWKLILKNFKIIIRSKVSSLIIIFGPLLVLLLAGYAFDNDKQFELSVGVHLPDGSDLSERFIESLSDKFTVIEYQSKTTCVNDVKDLNTHSCLVFPSDFKVSEGSANKIQIHVDNSKVNIVDLIQNALNGVILVEANQISTNLTEILLTSINDVSNKLDTWDDTLQKDVLPAQKFISDDIGSADTKLANLDLAYDPQSNTLNNLQNYGVLVQETIENLEDTAEDAIDELEDVIGDIRAENTTAAIRRQLDKAADDADVLRIQLAGAVNGTSEDVEVLRSSITSVLALIFEIETKISNTAELKADFETRFDAHLEKLSIINIKLSGVSSELNLMNVRLKNIQIKDADNIVNPVTSQIVPVLVNTSKLHYVFPSLMLLVIMFVCLMLGATIVVVEKLTPAKFRIFTTPSSDYVYILSIFFTVFAVALVQIVFLLSIAHFLFDLPAFSNFFPTLLILCLATTIFTLIGMSVGYIFNNEQTTILGAISIGSAFIMVSDIILPIESVNESMRSVLSHTPFILLSNLLRRSLLFQSPLSGMWIDLAIAGIYCVALLGLILLTHKLLKAVFLFHNLRQK